MSEIKLVVEYEQYEDGVTMEQLIHQLAEKPESAELTSLVIGDWGGSYENDSAAVVKAIVERKAQFPKLEKLFIGDMDYEECEVSWIMQSNIAPVLEAYPNLRSLTIKGASGLALDPARHERLEELTIICGGLDKSVLRSIAQGSFPRLKKLELYLGVDNYGFNATLDEVLAVAAPGKFPELAYLGLKDSEIQDEIAVALADAPILDQLHTLDLSLGTLTDEGGKALLASERVKKLSKLDLHYHYMSDELMLKWKRSGVNVDVSEQQEADEEDDFRYPFLTE